MRDRNCRGTRTVRPGSAGLLAGLLLALMLDTGTAAAQALRGYSIDLAWSDTGTYRKADGTTLSSRVSHSIKAYVSQTGRVFEYGASSAGSATSEGKSMTAMDQAGKMKLGRLKAWTVMEGRLTKLVHFPGGGTRVIAVSVDPTRTSCTMSSRDHADAGGRKSAVHLRTGEPLTIVSRTMEGSSCRVVKGNIFGADR